MAAGLGFKTFNSGDVLSAADVNGYLMQGVLVFASTAARDAAITAPAEGQFAFTKDTNSLFYYDGAAWVASGATGDIEGVTAGTGISGGGTSGTVTITNSMATAIDAKGDLIGGTGADTFSRLAVGANNTVLTADSSTATGLKWATPASGGSMTLLSTTSMNTGTATVSVSSISQSYESLFVLILNPTWGTGVAQLFLRIESSSSLQAAGAKMTSSGAGITAEPSSGINVNFSGQQSNTAGNIAAAVQIYNYTSSTHFKPFMFFTGDNASATIQGGVVATNTAVDEISIANQFGYNFSGGSILVYGVK
jgi:hypothetical protein